VEGGVKILWGSKDGGPESNVRMWGIEIKMLGSIILLNFGIGSREAFHTHAFNSWSWVLSGGLLERFEGGGHDRFHEPSMYPVKTLRTTYHKVIGCRFSNWVLTIRGPWCETWRERLPLEGNRERTLTHGRKEI
jgi:hypothetical protein